MNNEPRISQTSLSIPKKVIFCVHGKPSSGCCTVLESEVLDIENKSVDITKLAKENIDTTNMSK